MLTAAIVAQQLGIGARTVYALHAAGALPGYRFGRALRFAPADVAAYILKCRSTETARATAGSLNSTAVSRAGESELADYCRRAGLVLKPTHLTARKARAYTPSPPASSNRSTPSAALSLVTSPSTPHASSSTETS